MNQFAVILRLCWMLLLLAFCLVGMVVCGAAIWIVARHHPWALAVAAPMFFVYLWAIHATKPGWAVRLAVAITVQVTVLFATAFVLIEVT